MRREAEYMKTCEMYAKNLALFLDGMLTKEEQEELLQHVEECPACARRLEMYRVLLHEVEDLRVDPPSSMHEAIMEAVTAKKIPMPKRKFFGGMGPFTAATAAAAVILLVVGGVFGDLSNLYLFGRNTEAGSASVATQSTMMAPAAEPENGVLRKSKEDITSDNSDEKSASSDAAIAAAPVAPLAPSVSAAASSPAPQTETASAPAPAPNAAIQSGDNGSLKFSIAGAENTSIVCPQEIPLDGSFALVIVASGKDVSDLMINAKRQAESDGILYYAVENDETALADMSKSLSSKGFEITYFYEGADYIDAAAPEVLVVIEKQ